MVEERHPLGMVHFPETGETGKRHAVLSKAGVEHDTLVTHVVTAAGQPYRVFPVTSRAHRSILM